MTQFNFHNFEPGKSIHTHTQILPIIQRFIVVYKLWDELRNNFPRKSRYTLGVKIDELFLDTIELLFIAGSLNRTQKLPVLQKASGRKETCETSPITLSFECSRDCIVFGIENPPMLRTEYLHFLENMTARSRKP